MGPIVENCEQMSRIRKGLRLHGLLQSHACLFLTLDDLDWFTRGEIPNILEDALGLDAAREESEVAKFVNAINSLSLDPKDLHSFEEFKAQAFKEETFPEVFAILKRLRAMQPWQFVVIYEPRLDPIIETLDPDLVQRILLY